MNEKETGGTAFPTTELWSSAEKKWVHSASAGMTLRDFFAAKAVQAAITSSAIWVTGEAAEEVKTIDDFAALAYRIADAMLKAREA
jgi:hypothetical protein